WRGVDDQSWKGITTKRSEKRALLFEEILPFYRTLDIPIVFYSKEDPPNYNHFLPFAQQSDYIFTSAAETIPKYQKDCPEARSIDVLPRSEEHTSELQSRFDIVCRLLLEKKK